MKRLMLAWNVSAWWMRIAFLVIFFLLLRTGFGAFLSSSPTAVPAANGTGTPPAVPDMNSGSATEVEIPRTAGDKSMYFLLESKTQGDIIATLHKRVGMDGTGYSRTEINCKIMQYRSIGYSEDGPDKMAGTASNWTEVVPGSSKSNLVNFVCNRAP